MRRVRPAEELREWPLAWNIIVYGTHDDAAASTSQRWKVSLAQDLNSTPAVAVNLSASTQASTTTYKPPSSCACGRCSAAPPPRLPAGLKRVLYMLIPDSRTTASAV